MPKTRRFRRVRIILLLKVIPMNDEERISVIKEKLQEKRFIHSLEVAKEAKRLALLFGADEKKAYTAGLLHDVMKNAPPEEQLAVIKAGGVELSEIEKASPKLWHAIAGAVYIKLHSLSDDEEIISAVRYHTTGRKGMTLLEKVLFVADFTSLERDYDGADIMREVSNESLCKAMFEGTRFTICEIVTRCGAVHPDTLEMYNELSLTEEIKNYKPRIIL